MDIKQLAIQLTPEQFTELLARRFLLDAVSSWNGMEDVDRKEIGNGPEWIVDTAGWICTQGMYKGTEVPALINTLAKEYTWVL